MYSAQDVKGAVAHWFKSRREAFLSRMSCRLVQLEITRNEEVRYLA